MKLPKLYRKVYVKCRGHQCDEGLFHEDEYIKANLALDEDNNIFWQVDKEFNNAIDYEFSNMDIYDLGLDWSNIHHKKLSLKLRQKKRVHLASRNRWSIEYRNFMNEFPF